MGKWNRWTRELHRCVTLSIDLCYRDRVRWHRTAAPHRLAETLMWCFSQNFQSKLSMAPVITLEMRQKWHFLVYFRHRIRYYKVRRVVALMMQDRKQRQSKCDIRWWRIQVTNVTEKSRIWLCTNKVQTPTREENQWHPVDSFAKHCKYRSGAVAPVPDSCFFFEAMKQL
jgi:hypothetical protein